MDLFFTIISTLLETISATVHVVAATKEHNFFPSEAINGKPIEHVIECFLI